MYSLLGWSVPSTMDTDVWIYITISLFKLKHLYNILPWFILQELYSTNSTIVHAVSDWLCFCIKFTDYFELCAVTSWWFLPEIFSSYHHRLFDLAVCYLHGMMEIYLKHFLWLYLWLSSFIMCICITQGILVAGYIHFCMCGHHYVISSYFVFPSWGWKHHNILVESSCSSHYGMTLQFSGGCSTIFIVFMYCTILKRLWDHWWKGAI